MKKIGKLIAVEGIDGSGKTTFIDLLNKELINRGFQTVVTKEAGGTPLGKQLIDLLHYHKKHISDIAEYLLFAADRAQHFHEVVIPSLEQGKIVISDRMADSSLAYQGWGRQLSVDMIKQINSWAMNDIIPDVVLYLSIDWPTANHRLSQRKGIPTSFEKEKEAFWQRVTSGYEEIFKNRKDVIRLDARQYPEEIAGEALKQLQNHGIV